jgi:hypothetical protein
MLGDLPSAWQHHPAAGDRQAGKVRLWSAVRLTFLFALWCTHHAADEGLRTAQAVVRATVEELQRLMWAQFRAAAMADETVDALPTRLLTADLKPPKLQDFCEVWTHRDVLCSVVGAAGGGSSSLAMKLSLEHPVPAPGPGAA